MNSLILAKGEKSQRLKMDKSTIEFFGKNIIEIVIEKISGLFFQIFVVSVFPERFENYKSEKLTLVKDNVYCGPMGAIYTGLEFSDSEYNFVFACDMPFINKDFVMFMMEKVQVGYDIVIPEYNGFLEPLHCIYHKRVSTVMKKMIEEKQFQLKNLFTQVKVKYIRHNQIIKFGKPEIMFFNINTRTELKKAKEICEKWPQLLF